MGQRFCSTKSDAVLENWNVQQKEDKNQSCRSPFQGERRRRLSKQSESIKLSFSLENAPGASTMRLFGKKFIPGVRVEVENPENPEADLAKKSTNGNNKDILEIVSNHSEPSSVTTYEPNSEETTNCDEDEEENYESALESFEAFTRKCKLLVSKMT